MKKVIKLGTLIGILLIFCLGGWLGFKYWSQQNRSEEIKLTAVGDSLTQGVGDPDNRGGYVYLIHHKLQKALPDAKVTSNNFGIAGETSVQIDQRVRTNQRVRRNLRRSNVIVLTFGGNDLIHFIKNNLMLEKQAALDLQLTSFENDYAKNANRLLADIRRLNADAQVYVFGIYNPVYVYLPQVKFINQSINRTNKVTKSTVKKYPKMFFIPISNQLSDGEYQTKKQHRQLIRDAEKQPSLHQGLSTGSVLELFGANNADKNNLISNEDHFHPNQQGYQVMTQKLYQVMKPHLSALKEQ